MQCPKSAKTVVARRCAGGAATISDAKPLANGTMIKADEGARNSSRDGERQNTSSSMTSSSSGVGLESGRVQGVKPVAFIRFIGRRATDLKNQSIKQPRAAGGDGGAVIQPPAAKKTNANTLATSFPPQRPPPPPPLPSSQPGGFRCRDNTWYKTQLAKKQILPMDRHNENCKWDKEDEPFLKDGKPPGIRSYFVVNEPRTGSSWLQEVSYDHSAIKVQFELDFINSFDALRCQQCTRPKVPNSKYTSRIPSKSHPPKAYGMTVFGKANDIGNVCEAAEKHDAYLVLPLRMNHFAHAISMYFAFESRKKVQMSVPWDFRKLSREVSAMRLGFENFISGVNVPAHIVFYENMKREPVELQDSKIFPVMTGARSYVSECSARGPVL